MIDPQRFEEGIVITVPSTATTGVNGMPVEPDAACAGTINCAGRSTSSWRPEPVTR